MSLTETVYDLAHELWMEKANKRLPGKKVCPYSLPRLGRLCFTCAWGHTCCVHSKTDHRVNICNSCKSLLNQTLIPLFYSILPAVLKHIWHHICTPAALVPTGLSFPREAQCLSLLEAIWRKKKGEEPPFAQRKTKPIIKIVPLQAAGKSHTHIMAVCLCRLLCEHFLKLQAPWI